MQLVDFQKQEFLFRPWKRRRRRRRKYLMRIMYSEWFNRIQRLLLPIPWSKTEMQFIRWHNKFYNQKRRRKITKFIASFDFRSFSFHSIVKHWKKNQNKNAFLYAIDSLVHSFCCYRFDRLFNCSNFTFYKKCTHFFSISSLLLLHSVLNLTQNKQANYVSAFTRAHKPTKSNKYYFTFIWFWYR